MNLEFLAGPADRLATIIERSKIFHAVVSLAAITSVFWAVAFATGLALTFLQSSLWVPNPAPWVVDVYLAYQPYVFGLLSIGLLLAVAPIAVAGTADAVSTWCNELRASQQQPSLSSHPQDRSHGLTATGPSNSIDRGTHHEAAKKLPLLHNDVRELAQAAHVGFADLVQRGEIKPLLAAYVEERLREHEAGARPRPRSLVQRLFGTPNDTFARTEDILTDVAELTRAATRFVNAADQLQAAKIQAATGQLQYDLERAKLAAQIAQQRALAAQHEAAVASATLAKQTAEVRQVTTRAEALLTLGEHRQSPPQKPTPAQRRAERYAAAKDRRREELEQAEHSAGLREQEFRRELAAARIRGLTDPVARRRRQARRRREQEERHRLELAKLKAEVDERRTRGRVQRQHDVSAEVQFALKARQRMRRTAKRQRVYDTTKREIDAHLAQIANTHGEDSETYHDALQIYEELLGDLRDEVAS